MLRITTTKKSFFIFLFTLVFSISSTHVIAGKEGPTMFPTNKKSSSTEQLDSSSLLYNLSIRYASFALAPSSDKNNLHKSQIKSLKALEQLTIPPAHTVKIKNANRLEHIQALVVSGMLALQLGELKQWCKKNKHLINAMTTYWHDDYTHLKYPGQEAVNRLTDFELMSATLEILLVRANFPEYKEKNQLRFLSFVDEQIYQPFSIDPGNHFSFAIEAGCTTYLDRMKGRAYPGYKTLEEKKNKKFALDELCNTLSPFPYAMDVSHARRIVWLLSVMKGACVDSIRKQCLSLDSKIKIYIREFLKDIQYRGYKVPNYMNRTNYWYRVNYKKTPNSGLPPYGMKKHFLLSGYCAVLDDIELKSIIKKVGDSYISESKQNIDDIEQFQLRTTQRYCD